MTDRKDVYWLLALTAFVASLLVYSLGLASADFSAPFLYDGDALQYQAIFRTILTTGWYTETSLLGAPFGATHYDAPVPDGLFLAAVALLRPFTSNPALVFNLLFVAGFLLVAGCFFWAARSLGVPAPLAAAGALAYTFLPFHFLRMGHLFYTLYFLPPLVAACAAKLADASTPNRRWLDWKKVVLFIAAGSAGIYNAFFLMAVTAFGGLAAALVCRDVRRAALGATGAAIIAASAIMNLLPTLAYQVHNGPNAEVAKRNVGESEVYALKATQLLLPSRTHPLPLAREATRRYHAVALHVNENSTAALGVIGAAGFVATLGILLLRSRGFADVEGRRLDLLSKSNVFVFLIATMGGFGVLFSLLVSPQLRAWNRASIIIAALSLLALLLLLTRWIRNAGCERSRFRRTWILAAILAAVWAVDQAPQRALQSPSARHEHALDAAFVAAIANIVPPESMILQLPYTEYPERAEHFKEGYYGLMRPYLHDSTLRWSYGDMRGRRSDLWLRSLAARPIVEQLEIAARSGFHGVYVERRAYRDGGADVERQISAVLGRPAAQRSDGAGAFYRLVPVGAPAPVELLPPVRLLEGFYGWEREGQTVWAWARASAGLGLLNPDAQLRAAILDMKLHSPTARTITLRAEGAQPLTVTLKPGETRIVELRLALRPGENRLHLDTAEPAVKSAPGDPRVFTFAIFDPRLEAEK